MIGLLGKKIGMTQVFKENGILVPVTVIEVGPCPVISVKEDKAGGQQGLIGVDNGGHIDKPAR